MSVSAVALYRKVPLSVNVFRDRNVLVRETDDGMLENSYRVQIENIDFKAHRYQIKAQGLPVLQQLSDHGNTFEIPANTTIDIGLRLRTLPQYAGPSHPEITLAIEAQDNADIRVKERLAFIGQPAR